MLRKSTFRRTSFVSLQVLVAIFVVWASAIALLDDHCREKTLHLTLDGVAVGWLSATLQLLVLLTHRPAPLTVGSVWGLARMLVKHHVFYGIAGGFTLGVTLSVARCVFGW